METLTLKYLMLYPKAKIQAPVNRVGIVLNYYVKSNSITLQLENPTVEYRVNISDCELILRPLKNSLVQAEKEYLLKTFLKPNDYDFDCLFFDEIEESIAFLLYILPFNMVAKLIDYLRSINIDIDGLKEKGLCIYENK